jgi:hypothetical protein
MKHKPAIVLGLIVIAGIYVLWQYPEVLQKADVSDQGGQQPSTNTVPQSTKVQAYIGAMTISSKLYNALVPTTALTDATDVTTTLYRLDSSGGYTFPVVMGSNTATISVDEGVKTVIAEMQPSSSYILDTKSLLAQSYRFGTPTWCDANKNNQFTWCVPIDITGFEKDAGFQPNIPIGIPAFSKGTMTLTSPADKLALGQGKVQYTTEWEGTMSALGKAVALQKITITMNQTDSNMWFATDSYIKLPYKYNGKEKLYLGSDFTGTELASTYKYEYYFGDKTLKDALIIAVPNDGDTRVDFPVTLYTNFDADNEGISVTLRLDSIDASGANANTSDSVKWLEQ